MEKEQPNVLIHLGDCVEDFNKLKALYPKCQTYNVAGNCDAMLEVPDSGFFVLDGIHFFITHGHIYNVKYNLMRLAYAAREVEADIVLFGHTHAPLLLEEDQLVLMNPGPAVQGAYGLIETGETERQYRLCSI